MGKLLMVEYGVCVLAGFSAFWRDLILSSKKVL